MTAPHVGPQFAEEELGTAERQLLHAAATGTPVDLRIGDAQHDAPAHATAWGAERTVRAGVLIDLLTGQHTPEGGRLRAVKLRGARIVGELDLEEAELACPLVLADCHIEQPVNLRGATSPAIRLPGCHLPRLAADQLRTTGDLNLDGLTAEGPIALAGARIGGNLSLKAAHLANPGGHALRAEALTVTESMWCRDGFTSIGEIHISGARIGGRLSMVGARLSNPGGRALTGDGLTVEQSMTCRDGFTAEGEIRLPSAHLGRLSLVGARLSNPRGYALTADGLTIEHDLDCRDRFTADGEVHLRGATIGGTLHLTQARLNAPGADALAAARLTVGHDRFCRDLSVEGEVRLPGARISGRLDLNQAHLTNPGATALTADRLTVEDGVLGERLTANGQVRLPNAHVGGTLVLAGAHLTNPGGQALNADGLAADGDVHATDGFTAEGEIRLVGARIGGLLSFEAATLLNPGRRALYAFRLSTGGGLHCRAGFKAEGELLLAGARIDGYLDLSDSTLTKPGRQALDLEGTTAVALVLLPRHRPDGGVNLANARVEIFEDDPATWPTSIHLRGFTYDSLGPRSDKADVRTRVGWLARDPGGYAPQLYDQLAAAYRRAGDEQAAGKVAIAKQWRRRAVLNPAGKVANWLLYLTVGYGYRTWLAAIWLVGLLALGTWIFTAAYPHDLTRVDTRAPHFNALGYTLDVLLPIADLGQQKAWRAHGAAMYWSWAFTTAGWVLTTAVVAGLTGLLKRE
ncbi:hypothetical protein [Actinomadura fibrosa]|uniref:Oxidoreductase n=1 Tax=Actinomadura fibrosa TaxID=111802 RepID=A0ABW2XMC6_9ACTN|nr:hypothetical protein [Actinomadura fibrosa]